MVWYNYFNRWAYNKHSVCLCGKLTLSGHWMPSEPLTHSLSSAGQGEKTNGLSEIWAGRSLISYCLGQRNSIWGRFIYFQLKREQDSKKYNKTKTTFPYPPSSQAQHHSWLLYLLPGEHHGGFGKAVWSWFVTLHLSSSSLLTFFPHSSMGSLPWNAVLLCNMLHFFNTCSNMSPCGKVHSSGMDCSSTAFPWATTLARPSTPAWAPLHGLQLCSGMSLLQAASTAAPWAPPNCFSAGLSWSAGNLCSVIWSISSLISMTLVSADLLLSHFPHSFSQLLHSILYIFWNMLSQRCHLHTWWPQLWAVTGLPLSWLMVLSHTGLPCKPLLPKLFPVNPK